MLKLKGRYNEIEKSIQDTTEVTEKDKFMCVKSSQTRSYQILKVYFHSKQCHKILCSHSPQHHHLYNGFLVNNYLITLYSTENLLSYLILLL